MANNPQSEQERARREKADHPRFPERKLDQERGRRNSEQFAQGQPREASHRDDESLVGVDTDGDGKVVKPGQKPGQSHGRGLPESKPGHEAGQKR